MLSVDYFVSLLFLMLCFYTVKLNSHTSVTVCGLKTPLLSFFFLKSMLRVLLLTAEIAENVVLIASGYVFSNLD